MGTPWQNIKNHWLKETNKTESDYKYSVALERGIKLSELQFSCRNIIQRCIPLFQSHATQDESSQSTMPLLPSPMSLHKHWQQVPLGKSELKETTNPGGGWAHHGKNSKTTGQKRQTKRNQTTNIVSLWKEGLSSLNYSSPAEL